MSVALEESVAERYVGIGEIVRRTQWGTSRTYRLCLTGALRHKVLADGNLLINLNDAERVLAESK